MSNCTPAPLLSIDNFVTESKRPELKELTEIIIPNRAADWRTIGILLEFSSGALDIIERDCYHKSVECCIEMFSKWLDVDENATWEKLKKVLNSSSIIYKSASPTEVTAPNGNN